MKKILTQFAICMAFAAPAFAETPSKVKVYDHTKVVESKVPATSIKCRNVKVPVYEDVQVQGSASEGALAGMIIGGLLGKGVSGNDDGAAAGAVIGGLIGADKGAQTKTERRVIGHQYVEKCEEVYTYEIVQKEVYSHSTIRFYLDGQRYVLTFQK